MRKLYQNGDRDDPRRDLSMISNAKCTQSLAQDFHDHTCNFEIVQDKGSHTETVAFQDAHDRFKDPALHYGELWGSKKVYCDVPFDNPADPCLLSAKSDQ